MEKSKSEILQSLYTEFIWDLMDWNFSHSFSHFVLISYKIIPSYQVVVTYLMLFITSGTVFICTCEILYRTLCQKCAGLTMLS